MIGRRTITFLAFASSLLAGCGVNPPKSPLPTPADAIARMRATASCGVGVQASAKIDQLGPRGRIRGDLLLFALAPASLRMDAVSPFGATLATLMSDGKKFSLADLHDKRFYVGPATACNIARLTTVPIPPYVLGGLLRGQPTLLKHDPRAVTMEWSSKGYYVVHIAGTRDAEEELHLEPHPEDFGKPWQEQRMRLVDMTVTQRGRVLYHAELSGHASAPMASPRVDDAHIDPDVPPSGPQCTADLPRMIHLEVPGADEDVQLRYDHVTWNPPVLDGTFTQEPAPGMEVTPVDCKD